MSRSKTHKTVLTVLIIMSILVGAGIGFFAFNYVYTQSNKIKREVVVEAGSPVTLDLFFNEPMEDTAFISDVSRIDTTIPAIYAVDIRVWKFTVHTTLTIQDTTPPTGLPVSQIIFSDNLPDAQDCVTSVMDISPVSVRYEDAFPNVHEGGQYDVPVKLTDAYGNVTIIPVPFLVIDDHEGPVIFGTHDMDYWVGDSIQYRDGVGVWDEYDPRPDLVIDNSQVNPDAEGAYPVIYRATDDAGNVSEVIVTLTLTEKPADYEDMLLVYDYAQAVLDSITEPGMTDIEVAFRIFRWARNEIHYIGTSDKSTWINCALEGFTTYRGDCYTYYACCKALLDVAGIENMMVERNPVYSSMHFWNLVYLNDQWYHCDSCPSSSHDGYLFMCIDSELDTWNRFDETLLPERATESVQRYLNYYTLEFEEPQ